MHYFFRLQFVVSGLHHNAIAAFMIDANKMEMSKTRTSNIIHNATRVIHRSTSYSLPTSAVGSICHFAYVSIVVVVVLIIIW
jgi:hypothetical protein